MSRNHDENGIIWSTDAIAPFTVAIVPMNMHKSEVVQQFSENLYRILLSQGVDVIFDDRKERAGVMFVDMELIGVPHILVIVKNLQAGQVEYKIPKTGEKQMISKENLLFINSQIKI